MLEAVDSALVHARLAYVAAGLTLYGVSVALAAVRWRAILRGLDQRLPLGRLVLANMASSFVNNVTPASRLGGEACRIVALVRMRVGAAVGTASVVYERLSEVPSVAIIGAIGVIVIAPSAARLGSIVSVGRSAGPRAAALAAAGVVAIGIAAWTIRRAAAGRAALVASRWREIAASIRVAPSMLTAAIVLSALLWLLDVARLRVVAAAVGAPIGLAQAAALSAVSIVAGWVPTIGGLGAVEAGLLGGLMAFGVAPAEAAAMTAIERGISYGLATVAGAGALAWLGGGTMWRAVREQARASGGRR